MRDSNYTLAKARIHKKVFDFVIFSNLFIACCAVLMVRFTKDIFHLPVSYAFMGFVFFSTLASYSVHWYLTDTKTETTAGRTVWLSSNKRLHFSFFVISAIGSIVFLFLEISNFKWILPAVFLTLMYSAPKIPLPFFQNLKQHVWGKTLLLAAMWAYITSALPLLTEHVPWQLEHWLYLTNRFTLIFAICILFDIRDKDHDKNIGIKSIVTLLKANYVKTIFTIAVLLSVATALLLYPYFSGFWMPLILIVPAFLTYFLYDSAISTANDYLFYFILDGLMALSPILYFLLKFI